MFGLGIQELLLLAAVAIVVIGPRHLPQVARGLGRMLAQLQRAGNELRDLMHQEAERLEQDVGLEETKQEVQQELEKLGSQTRFGVLGRTKGSAKKTTKASQSRSKKASPIKASPIKESIKKND